MKALALRNGVKLEKGIFKGDSNYYLVDYVRGKEWHLSLQYASFLVGGRLWNDVESQDRQDFEQFLESNKLLSGQRVEKPKIPFYQKLMAIPIKLVRPHQYLEDTKPIWGWLFSVHGIILLLGLMLLALYALSGSYGEIVNYFGSYRGSEIYILMALVFVKTAHEFGHAMAIVKFGGYVSSINVVLIGGMPLPKNDAVRMHKTGYLERSIIGIAGIYLELVLALICAILWVVLDDGPLRVAVHFVAIVSLPLTVAINLIPLMKFDGYYILSSALKSPRLYENAVDSFRYEFYRFIGMKPENIVLTSNMSDALLVVYGALILGWKILLPIGLATALVSLFDARAAYVLALLPFFTMWVVPLMSEIKKLNKSYRENGVQRPSKALIVTSVVIISGLLWLLIPMNHSDTVDGAFLREGFVVRSTMEGKTSYLANEGEVEEGDKLVKIDPVSIDREIVQADIYEASARIASVKREVDTYSPDSLVERSKNTRDLVDALIQDGDIFSPRKGTWLPGETKPLVEVGDKVGRFLSDETRLTVYVPATKRLGESIDVVAVLPDGSTFKERVSKKGIINNTEMVPDWLDIHSRNGAFVVYESEVLKEKIPEMPTKIVIKRHYSFAYEFYKKITSVGLG